MNLVRLGRVARALRRRRGWRQRDVARACGLSQQTVSLLESGHAGTISMAVVDRLIGALGAEVDAVVRWRGGDLDRLLDESHAALTASIIGLLQRFGWLVRIELTYSRYGERGSIDVVAFHPGRRVLLVVEVKSDLTSGEETLRKHDEKTRLAPTIVRERFGWDARAVGRLLVLPATSTARRRIARHAGLFEAAHPDRGHVVRAWLRRPEGPLSGIAFLSSTKPGGGRGRERGPRRVRRDAATPG